jgi:hypothetical protein
MKFMAVMSFIGGGVLILCAIGAFVAASASNGYYYYRMAQPASLLIVTGIVYIIAAIVTISLGIYLFKTATGYSKYSFTKDSNELETAFLMQKKYWKTYGIVTIVIVSFIVLSLLVFVTHV